MPNAKTLVSRQEWSPIIYSVLRNSFAAADADSRVPDMDSVIASFSSLRVIVVLNASI
ncbi:unnamed protein product [Penicillium roqueforti FM164]|uniref:Genomic scaffold, ProqFM164S04 n=1 Tax=Penicillium roqueforti (strain FM164) TaxID=1365484 RepID=W6R1T4_PENRF|nr:unnamed protein product [Penicillium roqueforti FM164]